MVVVCAARSMPVARVAFSSRAPNAYRCFPAAAPHLALSLLSAQHNCQHQTMEQTGKPPACRSFPLRAEQLNLTDGTFMGASLSCDPCCQLSALPTSWCPICHLACACLLRRFRNVSRSGSCSTHALTPAIVVDHPVFADNLLSPEVVLGYKIPPATLQKLTLTASGPGSQLDLNLDGSCLFLPLPQISVCFDSNGRVAWLFPSVLPRTWRLCCWLSRLRVCATVCRC
jgi:hypothetical protein